MCICVCVLSCVRFFSTPWIVAPRLPCPWNFPGKNTRMHCHFLLLDSGIEPASLISSVLAELLFTTVLSGKPQEVTLRDPFLASKPKHSALFLHHEAISQKIHFDPGETPELCGTLWKQIDKCDSFLGLSLQITMSLVLQTEK